MKKSLIFTTLMCGTMAHAVEIKPYIGLGAIADLAPKQTSDSVDVKYKTGYAFEITGGTHLNNFRAEVELAFRAGIKSKDDLASKNGLPAGFIEPKSYYNSYMVNGYYDFKNSTSFTPYLGIGIGYATMRVKFDVNPQLKFMLPPQVLAQFENKSENGFAYQFGLGTGYAFTTNIFGDIGYRYNGVQLSDKENTRVGMHELRLGVRYVF